VEPAKENDGSYGLTTDWWDGHAAKEVGTGYGRLLQAGQRVPAGNVTIPSNHAIPQMGTVAEVRYLHAFAQSGAIYQPVYLGPRDDIPAEECTVDQLKFKQEAAVEV
jgi:hypothetical protein